MQGMTVYGIGFGDAGRTEEAVHWLERAAAAGDRLAPAAPATLYMEHGDFVRAGRWLRHAQATQTPVGVRMSLFKVWVRSRVPFDRPPRPPGAPITPADLGRAAERGGGLTVDQWNDLRDAMLRNGHGPTVLLMVTPQVNAKADAWFAFTALDPVQRAAPSPQPAPDPRLRQAEEGTPRDTGARREGTTRGPRTTTAKRRRPDPEMPGSTWASRCGSSGNSTRLNGVTTRPSSADSSPTAGTTWATSCSSVAAWARPGTAGGGQSRRAGRPRCLPFPAW